MREIKEYPNYYVTRNGDVYSTKRSNEPKKLRKTKTPQGYLAITLCNGSGQKRTLIHRLVAETFIPNPENKRTVNHKDGDRTNNDISNLEWNTYSENHKHAYKSLGRIHARPMLGKFGKEHNSSKTIYQFTKQGEFIREYGSVMEAHRMTNITRSSISACALGNRRYPHAGGYIWKYEKADKSHG